MTQIGFIGLGNMGGPMVRNLVRAGHRLKLFDASEAALTRAVAAGGEAAGSLRDATRGVDVVMTMLPAGPEVRAVYLGAGGVIEAAAPAALLIDCSTIDVATAGEVHAAAAEAGLAMLDAPVSGGVIGAEAATLTFMVGGEAGAFTRAKPLLGDLGKNIVHCGPAGNGQAVKICNNMIAGVAMIATCEAFVLAERLGVDPQVFFDVSSKSSGQTWAMTSYCPVPGPVPASPANRNYQAGFTAAMMLKDLRLAQMAAQGADTPTPLGAEAAALFALYCTAGHGGKDHSGIIRMLAGEAV